jgi:DNA processing protein
LAPGPDQAELFATATPGRLSDDERLACLRLIRSENVGPVTFRDLLNYYGGAQKAVEILPTLARRSSFGRPIRICSKAEAERELDAAERLGAVPVFALEPEYPALLAEIEAPPPLVYLKGRRELFTRPAVAIVGSRQCSAAGTQLARMFAHQLAEAGFMIVSGLARGIDRAAHDASLGSGTIAVVAGGIDFVYPPEHAELQAKIAVDGCLITERPPGLKPRDKDFPRRNRIIAGLVHGVVIVEAAARSGTLVTARYANELGREVFAVPGHPLDPRAEGTNRLIKHGATLVTEVSDIIDALRPIVGLTERAPLYRPMMTGDASLQRPERPPSSPDLAPDDVLNAVLRALGPAPVAIDAVARQTGLTAQSVQIALMELDLAGRIERQGRSLVALKPA